MGSKKKATKKKTTKKKVTKKAAKTEKDQFSQPMNPIDEAFEKISQEYNEYKREKVAYYQEQGIAVDVTSHEAHWFKVFVLGKLAIIEGERNEQKTTNKRSSNKTRNSDSRQLELGL